MSLIAASQLTGNRIRPIGTNQPKIHIALDSNEKILYIYNKILCSFILSSRTKVQETVSDYSTGGEKINAKEYKLGVY